MMGQRKQTTEIVGVRFKPSGRVYFFAPSGEELSVGDRVEVETDIGYREGTVVITPEQMRYSDLRGTLDPVARKIKGE